jgi:hypothetical protein
MSGHIRCVRHASVLFVGVLSVVLLQCLESRKLQLLCGLGVCAAVVGHRSAMRDASAVFFICHFH